jgi:hypothetical protein
MWDSAGQSSVLVCLLVPCPSAHALLRPGRVLGNERAEETVLDGYTTFLMATQLHKSVRQSRQRRMSFAGYTTPMATGWLQEIRIFSNAPRSTVQPSYTSKSTI